MCMRERESTRHNVCECVHERERERERVRERGCECGQRRGILTEATLVCTAPYWCVHRERGCLVATIDHGSSWPALRLTNGLPKIEKGHKNFPTNMGFLVARATTLSVALSDQGYASIGRQ